MNSEATEKLLKVIGVDLATKPDVNVEPEVRDDWKEELKQYEEQRKRKIHDELDVKADREKRRKRYEEYINRCEAFMNSKERLKRYEEYAKRNS